MISLFIHTKVFLLNDSLSMNSSGMMLSGKWATITFLTYFLNWLEIE